MMTMMATFLGEIDRHARECYDEGAGLTLRPLDPEADAPLLQRWFAMDYARFWSMQDHSVAQVRDFYAALCGSGHARPGSVRTRAAPPSWSSATTPPTTKLASTTRASGRHRHAHLHRSAHATHPGFSRDVFALVMRFLFDRLNAARVVVEPDANNAKIHALNLAMGFVYAGQARFREKPPASPSAPAPTSSRPNFRSPPYEPPCHATSVPGRQPP